MAMLNSVQEKVIHTIDLNFMGMPHSIAVYLIPHVHGAVLVESGPGSTIPSLQAGLKEHGLTEKDITDVFLTHIHLDHAGAAGWLARQGARIHVHPNGAPHLLDPEKLISSAQRIYGDMMDTLWGEFLPVPAERLSVLEDNAVVEVEGLRLRALDTPGHARHHYAYVFNDVCFTGDVGGIRLPGPQHVRLPMPPPEFNLEEWRHSLEKLRNEFMVGKFTAMAPTHFGIFRDPAWHLTALARSLDEIEAWMETVMPDNPSIEDLNNRFLAWTRERSIREGLDPAAMDTYEMANPSWMSPHGIQRYWKKHRA